MSYKIPKYLVINCSGSSGSVKDTRVILDVKGFCIKDLIEGVVDRLTGHLVRTVGNVRHGVGVIQNLEQLMKGEVDQVFATINLTFDTGAVIEEVNLSFTLIHEFILGSWGKSSPDLQVVKFLTDIEETL